MSEKPTISVSSTAQNASTSSSGLKGLENIIPQKAGSESSAQNSINFQGVNFNPGTFSSSEYEKHNVVITNIEEVNRADLPLVDQLAKQLDNLASQGIAMDADLLEYALRDKDGVKITKVSGSAVIRNQDQVANAIGNRGDDETLLYTIRRKNIPDDRLLSEGMKAITGKAIKAVSGEIEVSEVKQMPVVKALRVVGARFQELSAVEPVVNNQPQFNNNPVSNEQLSQITQFNVNPQPAPAGNPFLDPDKVTFTYLSEEEKKAA